MPMLKFAIRPPATGRRRNSVFLPVLALEAEEGRLFKPLAFTKTFALVAALLVSLVTGLLSGVLPARRAARLDPVQALAGR